MDVEGFSMPEKLYYHKGHMWAKVDGNIVKVGIDDFTQKLSGRISYLETPLEGDEIKQNDEVGTIETGKWVGKIYAPVSGKVSAINNEIIDDPTLINSDPYKNWIFEIRMENSGEINNLIKGNDVIEWLKGEIKKHAK